MFHLAYIGPPLALNIQSLIRLVLVLRIFYGFLQIYTDLYRFLGTQVPKLNPIKSLIRIRK